MVLEKIGLWYDAIMEFPQHILDFLKEPGSQDSRAITQSIKPFDFRREFAPLTK